VTRPNVVVFFTDQQRFDSLGVHGNPLGLTPNLDRMARTGTHFDHAFTPQPVCAPARAALQTGQYQNRTGVYRNECVLPPGIPTLAHHFAAAGYETSYVGKWHLAGTDDKPVPPELRGGYEQWLGADVVEFISSPFDAKLYDADGAAVALPGYRADAYVDAAIDYLSRPRTDPFLLFVSLIEPHHNNPDDDYPAPPGYAERYAGQWTPGDLAALGGTTEAHLPGYWGMVRRVDEAFGRLLDALAAHDLRDDTVVAFTSDHGCHFKTRNREYKRSAHDASIRVPLVLDGPGLRDGGRRDDLVSLIDLPPTLLDAAGLPVPDAMQGSSLLRERERDAVFVQISESHVGRAIRTRRWKYSVRAPHADGKADPGAPEYVEDLLYDLDADPHELTNLAGLPSHAPIAGRLREQLTELMVAAGEPAPVIHPTSESTKE
jgi:choline-sulfatase